MEEVASKASMPAEDLERIATGNFGALRKNTIIKICEAAGCQIEDFIRVIPD